MTQISWISWTSDLVFNEHMISGLYSFISPTFKLYSLISIDPYITILAGFYFSVYAQSKYVCMSCCVNAVQRAWKVKYFSLMQLNQTEVNAISAGRKILYLDHATFFHLTLFHLVLCIHICIYIYIHIHREIWIRHVLPKKTIDPESIPIYFLV